MRRERQECYKKSNLVAEVLRELPSEEEFVRKINRAVDGAIYDLKEPGNVADIAKVITKVNDLLTEEAGRLGLKVPPLPNPEDSAGKIA